MSNKIDDVIDVIVESKRVQQLKVLVYKLGVGLSVIVFLICAIAMVDSPKDAGFYLAVMMLPLLSFLTFTYLIAVHLKEPRDGS